MEMVVDGNQATWLLYDRLNIQLLAVIRARVF